MTLTLEELAASHGIETRYVSETGDARQLGDAALRSLLAVLRVDPDNGAPGRFETARHTPSLSCVSPSGRRLWGVTCQLYSLRSERTLGFGDFEDLAKLAEVAGAAGAGFLGVNPLHAPFLANPGHYSPYSPSTRRFLNPFCIAVDRLDGGSDVKARMVAEEPRLLDGLNDDLIDYARAGSVKARLLRAVFDEGRAVDGQALTAYRTRHGAGLEQFALFEAISAYVVAGGGGAGWLSWPESLRDVNGAAVAQFRNDHASDIAFHAWLQMVAEEQLHDAQRRALAAGMAVGLYLDLAVGVAPDGAETWIDPQVTVPDARVGSPPDMFNAAGQDWGLAPLSPEVLAERGYRPLAEAYDAMMQHAGAVRIDHVMGLARLWWIARGHDASEGGYVRYPLGAMVDVAADASRRHHCLVIGEDLGTVPDGFRPVMDEANILSYRVLYFEKRGGHGFVPPQDYPHRSLACISTHDLATLSGWWSGTDIELRQTLGRQDEAATDRDRLERDADRRALLRALDEQGLLPQDAKPYVAPDAALPDALSQDLAIAIHRFAARTASHLVAVQLDDMIMAKRQPNMPGTTDAYPNWRIRSEVPLEALAGNETFTSMASAMREERP